MLQLVILTSPLKAPKVLKCLGLNFPAAYYFRRCFFCYLTINMEHRLFEKYVYATVVVR
jgi:hypothetical protein